MKKPKPGLGNYSPCENCQRVGWVIQIKAARSRKNKNMRQSDQLEKCKTCKGVGWVDAKR